MNHLQSKIRATLKTTPLFKKVLVGCSGGIDSIVLTHILNSLDYQVVLAHLNHQLRGREADRDEAFVIETAKKWGLECVTKKVTIPKTGNSEDNARRLRYQFLHTERVMHQADLIAVGHHFDDQIETILMHQKRGCGLRGERGMSLLSGKILRPLIDIPRREIEVYAKEYQLDYVTDSSNLDIGFERNRLRQKVIPTLKRQAGFEEKIRAISRQAAEKLRVLKKKKQIWKEKHLSENQFSRVAFNELENDLKVEILIDLLGQQDLYRSTLDRLIRFMAEGKTGKELGMKAFIHNHLSFQGLTLESLPVAKNLGPLEDSRIKPGNDMISDRMQSLTFIIEYDQVRWYEQVPKSFKKTSLPSNQKLTLGSYHLKNTSSKPLYVRSWKPGDRFWPSGMKGSKKLQDFFTDEKIPKYGRLQIPVIVDEKDDIICVGNMRFSEKHKHFKNFITIQKQ